MKILRFLLAVSLLVFSSQFALAADGVEPSQEQPVLEGLCGESTDFLFPDVLIARRGCCSHHGGVSGECSGGRVVCNDGSLSPSCTCRADSLLPQIEG